MVDVDRSAASDGLGWRGMHNHMDRKWNMSHGDDALAS